MDKLVISASNYGMSASATLHQDSTLDDIFPALHGILIQLGYHPDSIISYGLDYFKNLENMEQFTNESLPVETSSPIEPLALIETPVIFVHYVIKLPLPETTVE